MRQIFLLRHGKSSWDDPALNDFDRPLNNRGRKNIRAMADFLHHDAIRPALVLCSTARRTQQTFEILAPRLEGVSVSIEPGLYEAAKHDLMKRLRQLDDYLSSVLVIGHNPGLEALAECLSAGQGDPKALAALAEKYPTGALAMLETPLARWAALDRGTCRLTRFVRPSDLD